MKKKGLFFFLLFFLAQSPVNSPAQPCAWFHVVRNPLIALSPSLGSFSTSGRGLGFPLVTCSAHAGQAVKHGAQCGEEELLPVWRHIYVKCKMYATGTRGKMTAVLVTLLGT